jgi:hypothetical protein
LPKLLLPNTLSTRAVAAKIHKYLSRVARQQFWQTARCTLPHAIGSMVKITQKLRQPFLVFVVYFPVTDFMFCQNPNELSILPSLSNT